MRFIWYNSYLVQYHICCPGGFFVADKTGAGPEIRNIWQNRNNRRKRRRDK